MIVDPNVHGVILSACKLKTRAQNWLIIEIMDNQTLAYYSSKAVDVALRYESTESPLAKYFAEAFLPLGKILDVGCGSGRDLTLLTSLGFDAYGVDATPEFVNIAQKLHPELLGRVIVGHLPGLENTFLGKFDGILCCAVLMHLDESILERSVHSFKEVLKNEGRILISVPAARPDAQETGRDQFGRLFKNYSSNYLKNVFEKVGFGLLKEWANEDALQRSGIEWLTQLYQRTD